MFCTKCKLKIVKNMFIPSEDSICRNIPCSGLSRHFEYRGKFSYILKSFPIFATKSSKRGSKPCLCQTFHFRFCRIECHMCIIVQRYVNVRMPHDVLQCFRVHPDVAKLVQNVWRRVCGVTAFGRAALLCLLYFFISPRNILS